MLQGFSGLIIALLLTVLLGYQATRAAPGSRLRQAYGLATGGFGVIIALNFLYLIGLASPLISNTVGLTAVALLFGGAAAFVVALFNGEFGAKLRQAQAYTAEERERLARQRHERTAAAPEQPARGDDTVGS
jgi:hypothetical protein